MSDPKDPKDDLGFALPEPAKLSPARAVVIGTVTAALLGGAFLAAWLPRRHAQKELAAETTQTSSERLRVDVVVPKVASSDRALSLPGAIQPLEETTVYARASGYVHKWNVDIGDKVKEGEVLAEIDTPDLDQQIDEAKATQTRMDASVVQSKASLTFSKQTLERTEAMVKNGVASTQELDQRRTQAQVDEANVTVAIATADAQRANLRRLMSLKQFSHVTAPFAGTVTERKAERGMLLTAGTGNPLFKIATIDPARVFIQVPQDVAPSIHPDLAAQVSVREFPGRTFDGKVARASGALDPQTRTMMTEIRVPNPKGELLSGMYAQIALSLPIPHHVFELPATAIQTDANGVRVATVTADGTVKLVRVVVERDTGPTVLIASGLDGTERVAKLASAELVDGRQVDIAK